MWAFRHFGFVHIALGCPTILANGPQTSFTLMLTVEDSEILFADFTAFDDAPLFGRVEPFEYADASVHPLRFKLY